MLVQRFLLLAVVLSAILHAHQPALASLRAMDLPKEPTPTWTDRKTVKLSRSITRIAFLQRQTVARSALIRRDIELAPVPVIHRADFHPIFLHLPPPTLG